jgi:serine/threonine protein kinase/Tol biopolymer transport system component
MALSAGTRLGPYEIVAPLGSGGMGEVYRARDTRLDRDVAVKVLAPGAAHAGSESSGEHRGRFEREARAIASLTHPHICTLFDVGHEGEIEFLVMELIEGTDLSVRLASGPLPLPEAIACASQVADALNAAHRLGIVHRDLKPANIMLVGGGSGRATTTPHVKLLDFGLAKLRAEHGEAVGGHTMTASLTAQGQILGTLHYMAPEQLEGRPVDARADLFAFGVIVFEMITGQRPFAGSSPASVIGAILREPVVPLSQVVPLVPPALDRIVSTCLAKDPEDRWSSAHDVLLQLRAVDATSTPDLRASGARPDTDGSADPRVEASPGAGPDEAPHRAAPAAARPGVASRRARLAWPLALVATAAFAAVAGGWLTRRATPALSSDPLIDRVSILAPEGSALQRSEAPQISPDGRRVAFVASDASGRNVIFVRDREALSARALPGTEDATLVFWAPDSRRLGFFAQAQIKTAAIDGSGARPVAPAPVGRGATWNRDDLILFVGTPADPPMIVNASGGQPARVPIPATSQGGRWFPVFLPDGRRYLFLASRSAEERAPHAVHVGSIDSADTKQLVESAASAAYVDPGYVLYRRGVALLAQRFDPDTLELRGSAQQVADDVGYNAISYQGLFSASSNGALVYQSSAPGSLLAWYDRGGTRLAIAAPPGDYSTICLTGDEKRVVYDLADPESGAVDLWSGDATGGTPSRLTFHRAVDFYPVCAPSGDEVVFASLREGAPNLLRLSASAPGAERVVHRSPLPKVASDWSRDGKLLVYSVLNRATGWDVAVLPAEGGEPQLFVPTPADERNGRLSPDGRWMAYVANESGASEVYVQPFPATGARWQVSRGGGGQPKWRADGRELFYVAQDRRLMAVAVSVSGAQLVLGDARALFATRLAGREATNPFSQYAVAANGTKFLLSTSTDTVLPITLVRNWPALLGR